MKLRVTRTIVIEGERDAVLDQLARSLLQQPDAGPWHSRNVTITCTDRKDEEIPDAPR